MNFKNLKTFEEFNWGTFKRGVYKDKRKTTSDYLTHKDVDPFGEEDWGGMLSFEDEFKEFLIKNKSLDRFLKNLKDKFYTDNISLWSQHVKPENYIEALFYVSGDDNLEYWKNLSKKWKKELRYL